MRYQKQNKTKQLEGDVQGTAQIGLKGVLLA